MTTSATAGEVVALTSKQLGEEKLRIRYSGGRFELVDHQNHILAHCARARSLSRWAMDERGADTLIHDYDLALDEDALVRAQVDAGLRGPKP